MQSADARSVGRPSDECEGRAVREAREVVRRRDGEDISEEQMEIE